MKISIITVCFNSAATLERALYSVIDQDWPKIEHIVIDGGSTDGTKEILEQLRSHLDVVVSEPDKGIYDAMNKGIQRATGDIICFLNADDYYANSGVLSKVAEKIISYKLDALIGDVAFFHPKDPKTLVRRYRSKYFTPSRLAWGWMPAHPALFLNRETVTRVGYFKTNYNIAGDFEFIIRAFHGHCIRYQYEPEVFVLMQTGGVSNSGLRAKFRLNQELLRACRENGIDTNLFKLLSRYPIKLLETININKS